MDQRTEFVLKAMRTDNFRALCAEYGVSAKTAASGVSVSCTLGWREWPSTRAGRTVMPIS